MHTALASVIDDHNDRRAGRNGEPGERIEVAADVQLLVNSEVVDEEAHTANISEMGMFVVTSKPLPIGTTAKFAIGLPSGATVDGFAEVIWIRPHFESVDRPNGMGMRYLGIRHDGRQQLRDFVFDTLASRSNAKATVSTHNALR